MATLAAPMDPNLLSNLTPEQTQAVTHVDGPLLVLAGPGSGKTTVVTRRVAYLIGQGIPPWQILALTFTNKAAGEMRSRVETLVSSELAGRRGLTISTFHSFGVRVLRRYAEDAALDPRFSVYDAADQRDAIKEAIADAGLDSKNWPVPMVAGVISDAKNKLQDAAEYAAQAGDFHSRTLARIFERYQSILHANRALDFDDLLRLTARLLRRQSLARQELVARYRYLMVDEYQDTNHAQFVIAHALSADHGNICVVGDPDQSIYGWRGADIGNILEFERVYPAARVVPLGRNFRSTGHIVAAAAGLIGHNRKRKEKALFSSLEDGERPSVVRCQDERHEAEVIAQALRRQHETGLAWREMAVLYRMNALSRVLEDALREGEIPYTIVRGTAFFDRMEIKDALAYLRLIANPADAVSLRRIINKPARGLGAAALQRLEAFSIQQGIAPLEALRRAGAAPDLGTRAVKAAAAFVALLERWAAAGAQELSLPELVDAVITESGLQAHYGAAEKDEEREERLANLAELVSAAAQWSPPEGDEGDAPAPPAPLMDRLRGFLESVALVSDADAVDPEAGSVTLMTLHTAKGLEYTFVALAGLEQGILPHIRFGEREVSDLEEERRLCYVGMTRARRHLLMTSAATRTLRGLSERRMMSQFIGELPPRAVVLSDHSDPLGSFEPPRRREAGGRRSGGSSRAAGYEVGCRVRHPTFGFGFIASLTPRPVGSAARVVFDRAGVKTLILDYAGLERVD